MHPNMPLGQLLWNGAIFIFSQKDYIKNSVQKSSSKPSDKSWAPGNLYKFAAKKLRIFMLLEKRRIDNSA